MEVGEGRAVGVDLGSPILYYVVEWEWEAVDIHLGKPIVCSVMKWKLGGRR